MYQQGVGGGSLSESHFVTRGPGVITWIATLMAEGVLHIKTPLKFSLFHRAGGCDE